jgi:hypothetical protein
MKFKLVQAKIIKKEIDPQTGIIWTYFSDGTRCRPLTKEDEETEVFLPDQDMN